MPLRWVLGAVLMFAAFAAVAVAMFFNSQELYFTVDELVQDESLYDDSLYQVSDASGIDAGDASSGADLVGPRLQVRGVVDFESVQRSVDVLELRFTLTGKDGRLPVVYHDVVPDTFEQAEAVTVGGRMSADGTFVADQLFVQCPSKYEAVPPGEEEATAAQDAPTHG